MLKKYNVNCECGSVQLELTGEPRVRGTCHCEDCRDLLNTPYHMVNAWMPEQVKTKKGEDKLVHHQHPSLRMQRVQCSNCGEVLYNTNAAGWKVMSQLLVAKNYGEIPQELQSQMHFFYDRRIVDVADDLPKK